MANQAHCGVADCDRSVAAFFEGEALCREHFISTCYARLDRYDELRKGSARSVLDADEMRRFIHECTRQADEIEHAAHDLDNLERAKLLHIILSASELASYLRRSPRKVSSIPVRISSTKLGGSWEEVTHTVLLSQHGASVRCNRFAKLGETLQIVRTDTGQEAEARVSWQRPVGNGDLRIGIEFVNCENFWGLDWAAVEDSR